MKSFEMSSKASWFFSTYLAMPCTIPQRQHATREQLVRALLVEARVVEDFTDAAAGQVLPRCVPMVRQHLVQQLMILLRQLRDRPLGVGLDVDDGQQQQRVVRGERAA